MSAAKWDDDFDFDDIDEPANKKKPNQKKKANQYDDDDFFDEPANKLPVIKNNNPSTKMLPPKRASSKYNPYTQNMQLKGNAYDDAYEEQVFEQPISSTNRNKQNEKSVLKQQAQEEDFYEDIDDIPVENRSSKQVGNTDKKVPSEKEDNDDYGDDDFEDAYGEDDFQEEVVEQEKVPEPVIKTQQPKKKSLLHLPPTANPTVKKQPPPKPPSRSKEIKEPPKRNLTSMKPQKQPLIRQNSQKSIKSVQSNRKRATSKSRPPLNNKLSTNNSFVPQKYTNQISKAFPDESVETLQALPADKITKMNDRVRAMIKRFNEELNTLINKNMLYLKAKKNQKTVTVEDRLRVYEEQKKNNETMIEYMEREFDKLCGRQGELREEQYQLMTQKKIQETKELIKEAQKTITRLKYEVKNSGNKLTKKGQDKKLAQELHHLKTVLIQSKKDQEKHEQKINKLEEQFTDLEGKIADIDYKIGECVDKAREKGIQLQSKEDLVKKYEQVKKKVEMSQNHRVKLENLLKTKSDIISHEKQQLRINIKNSETQIKNLYESINHSHGESVKVVQKAKTNPKVSPILATQLDQILQSLEQAQQIDSFSVRSESNRSQASQRPAKHNSISNSTKDQGLKSQNKTEVLDKANDDQSRPNLMKKKPKVNEFPIEDKKDEYGRIWKEDEKKKENKEEELKIQEKPVKKVDDQAQKKKPFSLKRRQGSAEYKAPGLQPENDNRVDKGPSQQGSLKLAQPETNLQIKKEEQKKEEVPSFAGPRMMKFKRKIGGADENKEKTQPQIKIQKEKDQQKPTFNLNTNIEPEKKQQENKPFVPKRFNLRNRQQQKKEEASYVPSIQKTEPKIEEKKKQEVTKPKQNNQYKFNFNQVEDPYSNNKSGRQESKPALESRKQSEKKIAIPALEEKQEEVKPRFNLRLRDRKKKEDNNDDGGYLPSGNSQKKINIQSNNKPKQEVSNPYAPSNQQKQQPKEEPVNNPYNPYSQQQTNIDVPSRRREGPIKKSKPQMNAAKQKINIYEQAEQAEGLNQFVTNEAKNKKNDAYEPSYGALDTKIEQKQPDLNDLLGLNKNNKKSNNDDLADLLGGGGQKKKNTKKKNQFFGDMDF